METQELVSEEAVAKNLRLTRLNLDLLVPVIMKGLKLDKVNEIYDEHSGRTGPAFAESILKGLGIDYSYIEEELNNIPRDEPFILLANHPYGGIDGLILLALITRIRPDFKVMANYLLQQLTPLSEHLVSVNPFEKSLKQGVNIAAIKRSLHLLYEGNPIGIFPAGEVSSLKLNNMKISDKIWNPVVGKMILKAGVKVVPVYFSGHNSLLFNLFGLVHPVLRTAKLPSELFNKKEETIRVRIGKAVSIKTIQEFTAPDALLRYLRAKTYALESSLDVQRHFHLPLFTPAKTPEPIISETPVKLLVEDIRRIESKRLLFRHEQFKVFISGARFIPNILREISRLREITFREVGEGTNLSFDTDEYDLHYKHLFIWDEEAQKIAGAYRIGLGDVLFRRYRKKGFYLNELFKIKKEFNPVLKSSLELGRSFVVKEYQKKPFSLLLLWKGVNLFLAKEQYRYKYLIGPVSISNSFSSLSKDLLVDFITRHHFDDTFAQYVKPRKKFKYQFKGEGKELRKINIDDIRLLDNMISEIETSQMKIPILLKKYLKQNARIIAFNVDPKFNHSLDGFLVMDLEHVPGETFDLVR